MMELWAHQVLSRRFFKGDMRAIPAGAILPFIACGPGAMLKVAGKNIE
jgi:hypothetical protein